jgi:hypothetical protein
MPDAAGRGFVDVNACFGPEHGIAGTADAPLSTLVAERRSHGIRLSLAYSLLAAVSDRLTGNPIAYEAAADAANGLAAIAVVAARRTGEAARAVAEAERRGAVGYRLEGWFGGAPESEAVREVLRAVASTGRPLLVPLSWRGPLHGFGEASAIGAATAGLGIPVILVGAHYNHIADDLAAAVRYEHLHLETSAMGHFRAIETAVATIGAERVLLGTGSARRAAGSAIDAVLCAAVPDEAKRAVLAGNATRLFRLADGDAPMDLTPPRMPPRALDVHTHFGPFDFDVPDVPDAELVGSLRTPPTPAAVASSAVGIFGDPARGNEQAIRTVTEARGSAQLAYVVADPADVDFSREQLDRHLRGSGMVGVKVHGQVSGVATATRAMADLFDLLAGYGRPVKIHNEGDGWEAALLEIARAHPRLPIVVAHSGLGTPSVAAARIAASTDNVYLEFSSSFASLAEVRRAVALAPSERLLWGSDAPLLEPAYVLGIYEDAGIVPEALERVFWSNAAELFGV